MIDNVRLDYNDWSHVTNQISKYWKYGNLDMKHKSSSDEPDKWKTILNIIDLIDIVKKLI